MVRGFFRMLVWVAMGMSAGCGNGGPTGHSDVVDLWSSDIGDAGGDLFFPDASADDAITDLRYPDSSHVDVRPDWGEWGRLCGDPTDCDSGYCIEVDGKSVCTITCVEECPEDWVCHGIQSSPDWTFVCVPRTGSLCRQCEDDSDCLNDGDMCVTIGSDGLWCGLDCSKGQICPKDYKCSDIQDDDGVMIGRQCLPSTGSCICNADINFTKKECSISNEFGKCYGEQTCNGAQGWTECSAVTPEAETCNGIDDNCGGGIDEGIPEDVCSITNEHGVCEGVSKCKGFAGMVCDGQVPEAEVCDGVDNNCDGIEDNGFIDTNQNGVADCVDPDDDGDGVLDGIDNCPMVFNSNQVDQDSDEQGDKCDSDLDGDDVDNGDDNCPEIANAFQEDADFDGVGNLCDNDQDGDLVPDLLDCDPLDPLVFPEAPERCNGIDDSCNGLVDEGFGDFDNDDLADCIDTDDDGDLDPDLTDCEPMEPSIGALASEVCNGIDDNCSGYADEGCPAVAVDIWPVPGLATVQSSDVRMTVRLDVPPSGSVSSDLQGVVLRFGSQGK